MQRGAPAVCWLLPVLSAVLGSSIWAAPTQAQTLTASPNHLEYSHSLSSETFASLELSYQGESGWADLFQLGTDSEHQAGEQDTGPEPLLLSLAGGWDWRNDPLSPTHGSKLEFGVEQLIPLQRGEIPVNRLSANYTQWLPVNLPGVSRGAQTLVLNVQGGSVLGDNSAFALGGADSVRGYNEGELGNGSRFVQATAEYRFPLLSAEALQLDGGVGTGIGIGGSVFVDYANALGTGATGEEEDGPGQGFGYGAGLNARTPLGLLRLEWAINDEQETKFGFRLGDRF